MKKLFLLGIVACLILSCSNSESNDNITIINGIYESLSKGDIDAFKAQLIPEAEWNEAENFLYDDGNPYIGADAILKGVMGRIGAEWDNFIVDERNTHGMLNNKVLVTGRYKATHKITGKKINAQVAHLWSLKDGKVISFQQYTDTKQFADAVK